MSVTILQARQVLTGGDDPPIHKGGVRVRGSKIVAVGRADDIREPEDEVLDFGEATLLPGLVECHEHLSGHDRYAIGDPSVVEPAMMYALVGAYHTRRLVRIGVTTARIPGAPGHIDLMIRRAIREGYLLKVAPPLRDEEDRQAMWRGLASGALDVIGSDYTGYTRALKLTGTLDGEAEEPEAGKENIFEIGAGLTTLEFMMPVVWTHGVNGGRMTLPRFVQVFCENPAKIFGIYPRKGILQPGSDADIVVWDPTMRHLVDEEHGISDFSTFKGTELLGMPVVTMVRGNVVIEDGELVGKPGRARYIPSDPDAAAYAPGGFDIT